MDRLEYEYNNAQPEPEFKVGDEVRFIEGFYSRGIVVGYESPTRALVKVNDGVVPVFIDNLTKEESGQFVTSKRSADSKVKPLESEDKFLNNYGY